MRRTTSILVVAVASLCAALSSTFSTEASAASTGKSKGKPKQECSVEAEGALSGKRSFELEAELDDGELEGELEFRDKPAKFEFDSTSITNLVVAGKLASVQGRGKTKGKNAPTLRFSVSLDAAARTFALQLSSGYSASGALPRKGKGDDDDRDDEIEIVGSCAFDGGSTPVLDTPRRVSATIGRGGGTVASGGLTLTIPAGALSVNTAITLTPMIDLADSPLAGTIVKGAKLEPEGLRFLRPAVLSFAMPASTPAANVIAFGSNGDGSELHLQPHELLAGTISLQLWHFSTAGASSGGSAAAAAVLSRPISNAERQAKQRIAAAHRACNAELAAGTPNGPACADVRPETVRALFDWYTNAVRPQLQSAANAPSFTAEASLAEWLAWEGEVRELFRNDPPPACGTLQTDCEAAHAFATTAVAAHAKRRLDNCTGTSLASQLRDVARMADFAGAGAIDITGPPLNLPDATNGDLIRECAHLKIEVTAFPAIAALNTSNRLRGRVTVDVFSGDDRTDVPFTLKVDGSLVTTFTAGGNFQTTLTPTTAGLPLNVTLEAEATDPSLQNTAFADIEQLVRPTRERLLLVAQGPTTVPAGGTLNLLVRVAGDGMTNDVTLTVGGPGSVGPTPVTPNAQGEATAAYTAPASTVNPNAQVTATLQDGTSATIPITIAVAVAVSLNPTSATLPAGGTQNVTATVSNSLLGVTWSATGGAIVATSSTTARYEAGSTAGTFSVTATSIADPTKSATATIVIQPPAAGRVTLVERGGRAFAGVRAVGLLGPFEGGVTLPIDDDDSDSESADDESLGSYLLDAFAAVAAGDLIVASGVGSATAQLDLTATPSRLFAFAAGQAEASSAGEGHPSVLGSGLARVSMGVTFDVSVASVPYSLDMLLAVDPGNECGLSFRRLLPTPATLATGGSDVSAAGTLSPGRYELEVECEASSSSPGGNPAGASAYLGQLEVGA
jgi:hypothetical protein